MTDCPFCALPAERILWSDPWCVAVRDHYPVARGHTLIIPRRHVASFRELTADEWSAVLQHVREVGARLQAEDPSIAGFNLGINDGRAAGQTIFHVHIHLIPRRAGDVRRPEGGVRGVIPGRRHYPGAGAPPPV